MKTFVVLFVVFVMAHGQDAPYLADGPGGNPFIDEINKANMGINGYDRNPNTQFNIMNPDPGFYRPTYPGAGVHSVNVVDNNGPYQPIATGPTLVQPGYPGHLNNYHNPGAVNIMNPDPAFNRPTYPGAGVHSVNVVDNNGPYQPVATGPTFVQPGYPGHLNTYPYGSPLRRGNTKSKK
ncbi:uncharacterized protein LOC113230687 isoform X2 [Hyposmocoma kahamanoa]|uniref:uncharacterized protein LOC113230687 isoform X2 n=1 Tax=Hyposmocoma kahamanoa TaxID=1477025 RepID=UPI000E6D8498|nr:uncharacterized protein LOC113230687 isoform X2 [Hyposmocoma kahamanoa]